jgi:hypothetical protein
VLASESQAKALIFSNNVGTLREMFASNQDRWRQFVAALSADTQLLLSHPPIASSWLPLSQHVEVITTAHDVLFERDIKGAFELGRQSTLRSMRSVYRFFIRVASPNHVIGRSTQMWDTFFRGNGAVQTNLLAPQLLQVQFRGITLPSEPFWEVQRGGFVALAELTRVQDVRTRYVGQTQPDDSTRVIEMSWSR